VQVRRFLPKITRADTRVVGARVMGDRDTIPHLVVVLRRAHIRGSSKNGCDNPSMSASLVSLIVVCCMLSTALAQSSSSPPPASRSQPANAQPTAPSKGFVLEDGTAVTLRLGRSLSSADAHAGDRVDFVRRSLAADVVRDPLRRASGAALDATTNTAGRTQHGT
jgi:hypothetical protein